MKDGTVVNDVVGPVRGWRPCWVTLTGPCGPVWHQGLHVDVSRGLPLGAGSKGGDCPRIASPLPYTWWGAWGRAYGWPSWSGGLRCVPSSSSPRRVAHEGGLEGEPPLMAALKEILW